MSRFFIHRPIFATVISLVIVIAGIVSFGALPIAKFPPVAPPTVQVTASYPGANAATIATTVASVIEQEVNGVEGMMYMSSVSASDGSYTLTVTFRLGTDMDIASVMVQNRVSRAEPKLPQEVRQQGITTKKVSTQILQFIALISPDGSQSGLQLSNFSLNVKDELSRIGGVGDVTLFGAGDYSMRIWLDPQMLKQRRLTTADVVAAVREQNVQVAAGQIGGAPAPPGTAFQYSINAQGRLVEPEEFKQIIIASAPGGRDLRVGDVAEVERGAKNYTYDAQFNGVPSSTIAVYQLPDANAMDTAAEIRAKMAKMRAANNWPQGVEYEIPFDTTRFVEASINEVYSTLIVAALLVILVIFIFLQDWRATIVPVAAIPVSLIGTFAVMSGIGFSINMLSLFGVVLAIGIVVDDAIVVVENTTRHLEAGLSPKDAAVKAMDEITGPVIATTLVLLAVFVPCAFMAGITGQLFKQFALTISAAVLISTINALTLSPALCGIVLRPPKQQTFIGFKLFNQGFDKVTSVYGRVISLFVRVVPIVMAVYLGLVFLTGVSFSRLPTGFVPSEDQGYLFVNVQLPDAASSQRTQEVMNELEEYYRTLPGVADTLSVAGYSLLTGNAGSNIGFSVVILKPWDERKSPDLSIDAIAATMQKKFQENKHAVVFGFQPPPIDGLGNAGGFQMEVLDQGNAGYAQLDATAQDMVAAGRGQTMLSSINTTFRAKVPQLFAEVDRSKVKSKQVPLNSVFATLQAYLGSTYINDFTYKNRSYQVRVQADSEFRARADQIRRLDVRDDQGRMVPLGSLVNVREDFGPDVVRRYNLYPAASLNGSAAAGVSSGQALKLMEEMAEQEMSAAFGYEWTGMSKQEKDAAGGQGVVLVLAVVFVFLVLAAQYESWTNPAAVIAVVPLAALGVVIALTMRGADNNTYTQIGLVLLVALASKNAILIVEFASEQRREGKTIQESATAAATLRFRAILMTAFSSVLGFLPLLIASGAGAASRQAVGNAVVGGMLAATVFSVLLVPTFFVMFQWLAEINSGSQAKAEAKQDPPKPAKPGKPAKPAKS